MPRPVSTHSMGLSALEARSLADPRTIATIATAIVTAVATGRIGVRYPAHGWPGQRMPARIWPPKTRLMRPAAPTAKTPTARIRWARDLRYHSIGRRRMAAED